MWSRATDPVPRMTSIARAPRTAPRLGATVVVAAGGATLLLARPFLVALGSAQTAGRLALIYVALAGGSVRIRTGHDAGPRPLHPGMVAIAGLAALALASVLTGPGIPVRAGAAAISLNVLAAVSEEAFFRRALYGRLVRFGAPAAVVVSALAFALVHLPPYGTAAFPVDLGAGLLLSWQRWASGTWLVPAATHAAANLLAVIP